MRWILMLALCAGLAVPAAANDAGSKPQPPGWLFGIGYVRAPNPYIGDGDEPSNWFPMIGYIGDRLTWMGPYASYRFTPDEAPVQLSTFITPRFEGVERDRADPRLRQLKRRHVAVEAGVSARAYGFELSVSGDVSGRHMGWEAALLTGTEFELTDRLSLNVGLSARLKSGKLANYYYGVASDEVAASLAAYKPGQSLSYGADIGLTYQLTDHITVMLEAGQEWFGRDIHTSPLVEDRAQRYAMFGITYQPRGAHR